MGDDVISRVEAIVRIEQALFLSEPDHIWHGSIADIQAGDLRELLALARSKGLDDHARYEIAEMVEMRFDAQPDVALNFAEQVLERLTATSACPARRLA